jgi:uncharacterized protein (DUF983 family)
MDAHEHPQVSPYIAGLTGKCPRCGEGNLFDGLLALAPSCGKCGLDYSFADAGDAPAIIVMTVAGFIVLGAVLIVEILYQPPYWVHALIALPLAAIFCIALLRPTKSMMIALQYFNKAEEGRPEK